VAAALLAPAAWIAASAPAQAKPVPTIPSAGQVQQARDAATAKAAQVAAVQAQLAAAQTRLDTLRVAAEQAAEAYDQAQIKLAAADQAAALARSSAAAAGASFAQARTDVGRIAAQTYRDGGDLGAMSAVLAPGGPQDVLDRAALLDSLATDRTRIMQRMDATRVVATLLQQQADNALKQQQDAAAALSDAQTRAQAAADSATAAVSATQAQQAALLGELARLRNTSVALEQQRQAALAAQAEAARQAAEAARQAALRRAAAAQAQQGGSGSGSAASTPPSSGSAQGSAGAGASAVAWAERRLGLPYQWGGAGPNSYDCSGLTMRAWQQAGVNLPHYAASQYDQSAKVSYNQMRPGDLIFYATNPSDSSTIHHVAMFVGGGMMIEAPYTGANVRIVPIRYGYEAMPWAGRP
jgi:cell wall-associated NlpC family hydrolase